MGVRSGPKIPTSGSEFELVENNWSSGTTTGWVKHSGSSTASVVSVGGVYRFRITSTAQNITYWKEQINNLVVGNTYVISLNSHTGSPATPNEYFYAGSSSVGTQYVDEANLNDKHMEFTFTATSASLYITIGHNCTSGLMVSEWSGISVKPVTSPLVLCLDAMNAKSFAGEPADNVYGDMSTSASLRPNRTEYHTETNWSGAPAPRPPEPIGRVYKHTSGALSSTWSGNSYGYSYKDITTTNAATYILSCWVYLSKDCDVTSFPTSIEGSTGNSVVTNFNVSYDLTQKGTWQLLALRCAADTSVRFIPVYPNKNGVTDGSFTGFYMWGGVMVHKHEHVVPWGYGDRSVTNAWKDLSGNGNHGSFSAAGFGDSGDYVLGRRGEILLPIGEHGKTQKEADLEHTDGGVASGAVASINFDGSNDSINVGDIGDVFGTSFTISMWINPDDVSNRKEFIGQYVDSNNWWRFGNDELGNWEIDVEDGGSRTVAVNPDWSVVVNQWHHIVLSRNASDWRFYKNGEEDGVGSDASTIPDMAASVYIGNVTSSAYFNGQIGAVQIYSTSLTHAQIKDMYNSQRSRFGL